MTRNYCISILLLTLLHSLFLSATTNTIDHDEYVTIAILAKDKAHTLPLFLECIQHQTWPTAKTYLYIRTNNNNDDTAQILRTWIEKVHDQYAGIYFDDTDLKENISCYKQHEWNSQRFKILGKIRQESIEWAYQHNSHYFVVDCDNFIKPHTLENLKRTNLPIVAPFIITGQDCYSNYHAAVDNHGYFKESPEYFTIFNRKIKGLFEVPVVHCTYFIQYEVLPFMSYDDNSYRYEYVIFSDTARKYNIPQYLDNREVYGYLTFAENDEDLQKKHWIKEIPDWIN